MPSPILAIAEFKKRFDPLLSSELDRHVARASTYTKDLDCSSLLRHVQEIALAGGKRIRPYAAYLMYRTAGGDEDTVLEMLVAFEIFHTFALVHDDIIDRGTMRHGRPAMHTFAKSFVSGSDEKKEHLAEGLALLVGDLAFSWSRETFTRHGATVEAQALFDSMVYAVVLGQILDVKIMCQENPTEAMIMEKTFLKTAEYTFTYPFRIGAALAGKSDEYQEWCTLMGTSLGIAFQVQDDLLDIIGDENATGKRSLQDVAEGQHTIFSAFVRTQSSKEYIDTLNAVFGKDTHKESSAHIRALFEDSGAIEYGKTLIAKEIANAKKMLGDTSMSPEARSAWDALIERMERRTA